MLKVVYYFCCKKIIYGVGIGWFYLLFAGLAEIVYAAAMPKTDGFTRVGPSLFCLIFVSLSMYSLSLAARTLPIGTAYAVWVGIGAIGTAAYGIIFLGEDGSYLRIFCFFLILSGIVGLKLLSHAEVVRQAA